MKPIKSIQYAKGIFLLLAISLFSTTLGAQTAPPIQWKKELGGTKAERPNAITNTPDGGYIIAGETRSNDIDVSGNHGDNDAWLIRLDSNGTVVWKKCFGGDYSELGQAIIATSDGNFVFAGQVHSFQNGDVGGLYPDTCQGCQTGNAWIVKINGSGNIVWKSNIGGSGGDNVYSVTQASDSGVVFVGFAQKSDRDVITTHKSDDIWMVKIDKNGILKWQKSIGGSGADRAEKIITTKDGGFIMTGLTTSSDNGVNKYHDSFEVWVVKTDSTGIIEWNKSYGGNYGEVGYDIVECIDGGYAFVGETNSTNGDVSNNKGQRDVWLVRLNDTGKVLWEKTYGGGYGDWGMTLKQVPDSGFAIGGYTVSIDGDITVSNGKTDAWVVRTGKTGTKLWQKSFGSMGDDYIFDMALTRDGYVFPVHVKGSGGDIGSFKGGADIAIFKLKENFKPTSVTEAIQDVDIKVYPSPTTGIVYIDLPQDYEKAEVKAYDMMGKVLQANVAQHGAKRTVDLSRFATGTYTIQVIHNGQQQSYKVINQQ